MLRKSEGLLAALPGSCTDRKQVYIATDAAAGQKLYWCNGTTFEAVGGGSAGATTELYATAPATALGTTASTQVATFTIPGGTLSVGDEVSCRMHLSKTGTSGSLRSQFRLNTVAAISGNIDTGNVSHTEQWLDVAILVTGSSAQKRQVMLRTHSGSLATTTPGTAWTAPIASDITISFEAWHTNAADTSTFDFMRCERKF